MTTSVAVDTMILVWGLDRPTRVKLELEYPKEKVNRAKCLLRYLFDKRHQIIVPTVQVCELLIPIAVADHGQFIGELQSRFYCPSLDLKASSVAANLWCTHRALPKDEQLGRLFVKNDILIVAAAKVAGATVFYSHDAKCRTLASQIMESRDLPDRDPDMPLFSADLPEPDSNKTKPDS